MTFQSIHFSSSFYNAPLSPDIWCSVSLSSILLLPASVYLWVSPRDLSKGVSSHNIWPPFFYSSSVFETQSARVQGQTWPRGTNDVVSSGSNSLVSARLPDASRIYKMCSPRVSRLIPCLLFRPVVPSVSLVCDPTHARTNEGRSVPFLSVESSFLPLCDGLRRIE